MTSDEVGKKKFTRELDSYLREAKRFRLLSGPEERLLAELAQAGDLEARKTLVQHNLLYVLFIARRYTKFGVRLDDIVQEGNLGLMKAAEKFDPQRGLRFSTYAVWWIRAYISKYLKQARSVVRPHSQENAVTDLSLDAPVGEDEGLSHLELIEDDSPSPDARLGDKELSAHVRKELWRFRKRFNEIEWDIIFHRIATDEPWLTLEDLGQRWGVSRERVRQLELRVRARLETLLAA